MNKIKNPQELLDFMSNNINYGYLGKDGRVYNYTDPDFEQEWFKEYILETHEQVLENLSGNCWDQVEFERAWFLENNYEIKTIYEMVLLDYDNDYPSHSFLTYKENNNWYWFENADFNNRGIHKFNSFEELINYQYKKHLELLNTFNITDEEIEKIIITEFTKPKENSTAHEYLEHVINSKQLIDKKRVFNLNNIKKIHTTELGNKRIKKNLKIANVDIINYLKEIIKSDECIIYKKGKNYYCETADIIITINSYNFCVITAHRVNK